MGCIVAVVVSVVDDRVSYTVDLIGVPGLIDNCECWWTVRDSCWNFDWLFRGAMMTRITITESSRVCLHCAGVNQG